jgi:uncharacterized protein YcbK (DUF882 family)
MGDLSENFSKSEFICKCGCGKSYVDLRLVSRLQLIRDIAELSININSGCRCAKHNKVTGGTPNSAHIKGLAVDWCFKDHDDTLLEKICTKLLQNWSGGFHFYPARTLTDGTHQSAFCHSDLKERRRW